MNFPHFHIALLIVNFGYDIDCTLPHKLKQNLPVSIKFVDTFSPSLLWKLIRMACKHECIHTIGLFAVPNNPSLAAEQPYCGWPFKIHKSHDN